MESDSFKVEICDSLEYVLGSFNPFEEDGIKNFIAILPKFPDVCVCIYIHIHSYKYCIFQTTTHAVIDIYGSYQRRLIPKSPANRMAQQ